MKKGFDFGLGLTIGFGAGIFALYIIASRDWNDVVGAVSPPPAAAATTTRFTPSTDWKPIGDTDVLPPGLEIRIDVSTGLKEARINRK